MRYGAAVMSRLAATPGQQPRCGDVSVNQGDEGVAEGGEFISEHREPARQGVDKYPRERPALGDCVTLALRQG